MSSMDRLVVRLLEEVGVSSSSRSSSNNSSSNNSSNSSLVKGYSSLLEGNIAKYDIPRSLSSSLVNKVEAAATQPHSFRLNYDYLKDKVGINTTYYYDLLWLTTITYYDLLLSLTTTYYYDLLSLTTITYLSLSHW